MDKPPHDELLKELRRMTKLLVLIATKDQKQKDQIRILDSLNFQPKEIADWLGTTANNVRVALHSLRKKGKSQKGQTEQPPN